MSETLCEVHVSRLGRSRNVNREGSVVVQAAQPRGQAQEPLHAFELVEPVLGDLDQERVARDRYAGGTRIARFFAHHLAVLGKGALAEAGSLETVLAEEHENGY